MKRTKLCCLGATMMGLLMPASGASDASLPGYAPGAKVMQVEIRREPIDSFNGIVYSQIKHGRTTRQLRMTILAPRTAALKPAILYFPGGGFTSADYEKFIAMRYALARAGFVVAAAEYRVVPDTYPGLVEDGKSAVRYLRAHAEEYQIDPKRIGVLGDSAGGYLAQMVALTGGEKAFDVGQNLDQSSSVQAAATLYGISNLLNIGEGFPPDIVRVHKSAAVTEALLLNGPAFGASPGAPVDAAPARALAASPMGHVRGGHKPPFLIMHGSADTLVSPVQSRQLYQALKAENSPADYIVLKGAGHGDDTWYQQPVIDEVVSWFRRTLGAPTPAKESAVKGDNL